MDTLETTNNNELEQQFDQQRIINDKLLRKYIIARTKSIPYEFLSLLLAAVLTLGLGIIAHHYLYLEWPVIVAICSALVLTALYKLIISLPLSKGNITMMCPNDLPHKLLQYKKRDIIGSTCAVLIVTATLVWLAFELRDVCTWHFSRFENNDEIGDLFFFLTIVVTIIIALAGIYDIYSTSKNIDSIVEDINELKID